MRSGLPTLTLTPAAALVSATTSLPPLRATDFVPALETPSPLMNVVVVHCSPPCLGVHVWRVVSPGRANVRPRGNPMASEAIPAAPRPWLALMRSSGWPVASPLTEPLAIGLAGQRVSVTAELTVFVAPL